MPDLLFPEFYYEPIYDSDVWENRTAGLPTFMWNQVSGTLSYTIEVADNKFFSPISWTLTTENLSATPTSTLFLDEAGVYYWRVRAVTDCFGSSLPWSQRWETRVDQTRQVFAPTAAPPRLLQPTNQLEGDGLTYGQQVLEHFPHLDWMPVSGADHYEVQIATSSDFASSLVESAETELTSYTPIKRYPPDTYYWRVRAEDGAGAPIGGWSDTYHFALMRQFSPEPIYSTVYDKLNAAFTPTALLTEDPLDDQSGGDSYDLSVLYTALDNQFWYFGWAVRDSTQPSRFQLYLDPEGADGEGMNTNPSGGDLPNADEPYRPEYVLDSEFGAGGVVTVTFFFRSGGVWDYEPLLAIQGYAVFSDTEIYSDTAGFVALAVPHTAVGSPATMNCHLVSLDESDNVMDMMDRGYVTVSTAPTPRTPPNSHVDDARHVVYPRMPLMTWHTLTNIRTVLYRSNVDVSFPGNQNDQTEYGEIPSEMPFSGSNPYYLSAKVYPDNTTHYWQLRSRYPDPWNDDSRETTWSRPVRFTKRAQVPTNLTVSEAVVSGTLFSYVNKTPVFSWDPVQGAAGYRFELSGGGYSRLLHGSSSNFYIPPEAISNGDFDWQVRIIDGSANWSLDNYAEAHFHKGSDTPTALFPIGSDTFTDTVHFRWGTLTGVARYKVEVASDYNFSINYRQYDRINNTVYAPEQIPKAVEEGNFYWRVCGYNGNGHPMGCESYYMERFPEAIYLPLVLKN